MNQKNNAPLDRVGSRGSFTGSTYGDNSGHRKRAPAVADTMSKGSLGESLSETTGLNVTVNLND